MPLALWRRWAEAGTTWGANFQPRPDSLEYAALAHSIAHFDDYFLQIGDLQLPPRYPPGWPLLLSAAVRMGVPGEQLWWLTSGFSALTAVLIAVYVFSSRKFLFQGNDSFTDTIFFLTAIAAGLVWCFAPLPHFMGQTLLSDPAANVISLIIFALVIKSLFASRNTISRPVIALLTGSLLGCLMAVRQAPALLIGPPLLILITYVSIQQGFRNILPALASGLLGLVASILLVQEMTNTHFLHWSEGYSFWVPHWYTNIQDTFNLKYALEGNTELINQNRGSHFLYGMKILAGIREPNNWNISYIGLLWPLLGWFWLIWMISRRTWQTSPLVLLISGSIVIWALITLIFYALYFYPAPRFYITIQALSVILLGISAAWSFIHGHKITRCLILVTMLTILVNTFVLGNWLPQVRDHVQPDQLAAAVDKWIKTDEADRKITSTGFDPIVAQALGLLHPETIKHLNEWGQLPRTAHTARLLAKGLLKPSQVAPAVE